MYFKYFFSANTTKDYRVIYSREFFMHGIVKDALLPYHLQVLTKCISDAGIAQLVEQRFCKP